MPSFPGFPRSACAVRALQPATVMRGVLSVVSVVGLAGAVGLAACSGSSATIDLTSPADGGSPPNDAAPIDPPSGRDAGADASSDFIYGSCSASTTKPLTAGS